MQPLLAVEYIVHSRESRVSMIHRPQHLGGNGSFEVDESMLLNRGVETRQIAGLRNWETT